MADPRIRQIKIKTGVVKRLTKEKSMYEKEVTTQDDKVKKLTDEGADEYTIRKQNEVLQESRMMIPDTKKRLKTAFGELQQMLDTEADLKEAEEFTQAQEVLEGAKDALA